MHENSSDDWSDDFLFKYSDSRLITAPLLLLLYMKSWSMQFGFSLGQEFTNKKALIKSELKADFFQSISNQSKIYFAKQVFDIYDTQCFRSLFRFIDDLFILVVITILGLYESVSTLGCRVSWICCTHVLTCPPILRLSMYQYIFILQSLDTHQLYSGNLHFT